MAEMNDAIEKPILWRTVGKLAVYFSALFVFLFGLLLWAPEIYRKLPFGGVEDIGNRNVADQQLQSIVSGEAGVIDVISEAPILDVARLDVPISLLIAMVGSLILMIPVAWVYRAINENSWHDHSLSKTIILLPAVLASIVIVVQHSLALAFALAGIAAGVRFRRALVDTIDTLFIFVAIAIGIAAGIEALGIALVLSFFFCFATIFVCMTGDGLESHYRTVRKQDKMELREKEHRERLEATQSGAQGRDDAE